MSNKVIRLFLDVDMRNQHAGLMAYALEKKVDLRNLASGEHVVFLNHDLNRMKVFSPGGVLTYKYQEKGRFDIQAFSEVAKAFNKDGTLNFDKALKESLLKRLEKKRANQVRQKQE